jgi:hypothetical protein
MNRTGLMASVVALGLYAIANRGLTGAGLDALNAPAANPNDASTCHQQCRKQMDRCNNGCGNDNACVSQCYRDWGSCDGRC